LRLIEDLEFLRIKRSFAFYGRLLKPVFYAGRYS
jgi:hypothetical protein